MRYCRHCGGSLEDGDTFCSKCGKFTEEKSDEQFYSRRTDAVNEPKEKLFCELAYTGVLILASIPAMKEDFLNTEEKSMRIDQSTIKINAAQLVLKYCIRLFVPLM